MDALLGRLERIVGDLEGPGAAGGAGPSAVPPSLAAYDELVQNSVTPFVETCTRLGPDYTGCGQVIQEGFAGVRVVLEAARECDKPGEDALVQFMQSSVIAAIQKGGALPDKKSLACNHQTAISESCQALQWPLITPTPGSFVQGALEASDFYLNKILTTNKDSPQIKDHREFVKLLKESLTGLQAYIKKFHTTGVSWKAGGNKLSEWKPSSQGGASKPAAPTSPEAKLAALIERLESVSLKKAPNAGAANGGDAATAISVLDFDQLVTEHVMPFIDAAKKLGGDCLKIAEIAENIFKEERTFIVAAAEMQKPSEPQLTPALTKLKDLIKAAGALPNNRSNMFNHQKGFAEFVTATTWVTVTPTPGSHVQNALESADFYLSKVLSGSKDAPDKAVHRDFVKYLKSTLVELQAYIKKHHTTGLVWNAKGKEFKM